MQASIPGVDGDVCGATNLYLVNRPFGPSALRRRGMFQRAFQPAS